MRWTSWLDKVFVVSLQKRKERREKIKEQFIQHAISYRIWNAVEREDGAQGLKETMKYLFQFCILHEMDRVGVFEDDSMFIENPEILDDCISEIPDGWQLFYPGLTLICPPEKVSENILRVRAAYATHSVFYSLGAMKLILPLLETCSEPFDVILQKHIQPLGKSYCSRTLLTTQDTVPSDIYKPTQQDLDRNPLVASLYDKETGAMNWDYFIKGGFETHTKNL